MNFYQSLIKYKQTINMVLSLLLVVAFFIPWFSLNPDFKMFAVSETKLSGLQIVQGIHFAAPTVSLLGEAYGFPLISKFIYLGYLIILLPIVGIAGIVMSGMRHPKAVLLHKIHFIGTLGLLAFFMILANFNKDMRELFFSVMILGFGFYVSVLIAIVGITLNQIKREK